MRASTRLGMTVTAVVALVAAVLVAPTATAAPVTEQNRYQSWGSPGYQYYLSLGDSLGFGYSDANLVRAEAILTGHGTIEAALDAFAGYTQDVSDYLAISGPTTNLSCPGETTTSMIHGPCPAAAVVAPFGQSWPYGTTPQLTAATKVLRTHRWERGLITLSIGSDDLLGIVDNPFTANCLTNPTCPEIGAALKTVRMNLATILRTLHRAAPLATIVVLAPYNPFGHADPISNLAAVALDLTLAITDLLNGARTADAFVPINVQNATTFDCGSLVYYCTSPSNTDVHPTPAGYRVIAGAFEKVLG